MDCRRLLPLRGALLAAGALALCCLPALGAPPVLTEAFVLTASDAAEWDRFGVAVDRDGDLLVATTAPAYGPWAMTGAAYVFRFDGTTWIEEAKLVPHDPQPYDGFGIRAAIQGEVIVVGASNKDGTHAYEGAAYVFRHDGTGWHEEAKLVSPDAGYLENFGLGIALDGDVLAVGSPRENDRGKWSGAVWIYRYEAGTWTPTQKILASNGTIGAGFGWSVALHGDVLVVGATHPYTRGRGEAYVYRFDGTRWNEEGRLTCPDGHPQDWFADRVAGSGSLAVVGAPGHDASEPDQGAAYVYRRRGGTWTFEQKLVPSEPYALAYAGADVAISATRAFVGAVGAYMGAPGRVSVYRWTPAGWVEDVDLQASDGIPRNGFGYDLVHEGTEVLVGALDSTAGGAPFGGAVYGFDLAPPPGPTDWLETLIETVRALDLPRGVERSLIAKIEAALLLLQDDNVADDVGVVGTLEALLHQVDALTPAPIPPEAAGTLQRIVEQILLLLEAD